MSERPTGSDRGASPDSMGEPLDVGALMADAESHKGSTPDTSEDIPVAVEPLDGDARSAELRAGADTTAETPVADTTIDTTPAKPATPRTEADFLAENRARAASLRAEAAQQREDEVRVLKDKRYSEDSGEDLARDKARSERSDEAGRRNMSAADRIAELGARLGTLDGEDAVSEKVEDSEKLTVSKDASLDTVLKSISENQGLTDKEQRSLRGSTGYLRRGAKGTAEPKPESFDKVIAFLAENEAGLSIQKATASKERQAELDLKLQESKAARAELQKWRNESSSEKKEKAPKTPEDKRPGAERVVSPELSDRIKAKDEALREYVIAKRERGKIFRRVSAEELTAKEQKYRAAVVEYMRAQMGPEQLEGLDSHQIENRLMSLYLKEVNSQTMAELDQYQTGKYEKFKRFLSTHPKVRMAVGFALLGGALAAGAAGAVPASAGLLALRAAWGGIGTAVAVEGGIDALDQKLSKKFGKRKDLSEDELKQLNKEEVWERFRARQGAHLARGERFTDEEKIVNDAMYNEQLNDLRISISREMAQGITVDQIISSHLSEELREYNENLQVAQNRERTKKIARRVTAVAAGLVAGGAVAYFGAQKLTGGGPKVAPGGGGGASASAVEVAPAPKVPDVLTHRVGSGDSYWSVSEDLIQRQYPRIGRGPLTIATDILKDNWKEAGNGLNGESGLAALKVAGRGLNPGELISIPESKIADAVAAAIAQAK